MGLVETRKASRLAIMMQTDKNKEMVYNACKEKAMSGKDVKELFGFSFHQAKAYLQTLEEDGHVIKHKFYSKPNHCWIAQYKSTELVYKPRTEEQVMEYLVKVYGGRSTLQFGEGKYDELIANNPNLRKVSLFEDKDHDYFRQPIKKSGKTGIGSSFSLYDNFSD